MATTQKHHKKSRTSVGSGKTKGAVSLAYVNLKDLLSIVREDTNIPIGRVFGESLGFKLRKKKGSAPELTLD